LVKIFDPQNRKSFISLVDAGIFKGNKAFVDSITNVLSPLWVRFPEFPKAVGVFTAS
jgi:hypothetical protein